MDSDDSGPNFLDEDEMSRFLDEQGQNLENSHNNVSISSTSSDELTSNPTKIYDNPSFYHLKILKKYFGHSNFRPMQWQIISSLLRDKRDNCAIMSTGYGKSLCYQYPAVYSGGITLVISPLISLMEDQVLSLKVANIPACLLGTAQREKSKVLEQIFDKKFCIIYLTPEFATGEYGSDLLKQMKAKLDICLVAIDEAHCISSWGHDFRAQYRQLGSIRDVLPNIPVLAITATATQQVEKDIIKSLCLKNPQILHSGCDRPNLYLEVQHKSSQGSSMDFNKVLDRVCGTWKFPGPTIIYCLTRKITETIAELLQSRGINCAAYHAGKSLKERKDAHEKFLKDQLDAIVATSAFGMGIDKPDIRCIVHYGTPSSIEAYYQEIGRAGRDGEPSRCVLFYSEADFNTHLMISDQNFSNSRQNQKEQMSSKMRKYLLSTECRRSFILSYFGENYSSKNEHCCDVCYAKNSGKQEKYEGVDKEGYYDFTIDARKFLKTMDVLKGKYGLSIYILFLRGSKTAKLKNNLDNPLHGCGKNKSENWWKSLGHILVDEGYIMKKPYSMKGFSNFVYILTDKGLDFLENLDSKILLKPTSDILEQLKTPKYTINQPQPQTNSVLIQNVVMRNKQDEIDKKLYSLILERRNQIADERDCMPHNVISIPDLKELIRIKPRNLSEFSKCNLELFSEFKIHQFGQELIDIIVREVGPGVESEDSENSIVKALLKVPIQTKSNSSAELSYNLFKQGRSIQEISEQRSMAPSTIFGHLLENMQKGLPIKLEQLGVNEPARLSIMRAYLETSNSLLTPIKEKCPPEITWDQIRAVLTYVKIRDHLKNNQINYEDFEDFSYDDLRSKAQALNSVNDTKEDADLDEFLKVCSDLIEQDELNAGKTNGKRKLENSTEEKPYCGGKSEDFFDSDDEIFRSPPRSDFVSDSPVPNKILKLS